jgi:antitoxin MazE
VWKRIIGGLAMEEALKLRKWGNSNAIRLPKEMLKQVGITPSDDEVSVTVTNNSIVIKPKKEEKLLDKLFENYNDDQPYPFEVVNKGGTVGKELY